jgi:hypothetical protein
MKTFMLSYLSELEIDGDLVTHAVNVEKIKANSDKEALGALLASGHTAEELADGLVGYPRPLDPNCVVIIELTPELAEDILADSL